MSPRPPVSRTLKGTFCSSRPTVSSGITLTLLSLLLKLAPIPIGWPGPKNSGRRTQSHPVLKNLLVVAAPVLRGLRDDTGETATLSVLSSHSRIYLDQYESSQEIKMVVETGVPHPLHSGASSRAIVAFLPDIYTEEAVAQMRQLKPDFDERLYRNTLHKVREDGYAVSLNERNTGAASIAAPFFDRSGNVLGSISSCGPIFRFNLEDSAEHAQKVVAAAHQITDLLNR